MMQVRCKFMTREPADRGDLTILSGRPTPCSDEAGDVGSYSRTVGATNQRRGTWNSSSALPHSPRPPGVSVSLVFGGLSCRAPLSLVIQSYTVIPEEDFVLLPCPALGHGCGIDQPPDIILPLRPKLPRQKKHPTTHIPTREISLEPFFLSPWTRIGAENR